MKVITIKQPWASLIAYGYKKYEFRTWRTKIRGEVLIHAAKGIDKKHMKSFEHLNMEYPTGKIIAKVNITDCIEVDTSFRNELNKENPIVYGFKEEWTGYAFKLEDVVMLDNQEEVNGQLGFWNYNIEK